MAVVLLLAAFITPADAACPDGGSSCMCGAGHFVFAPSLSCSGSCPCTPWVGLNESSISSNSEGSLLYENGADCTWTISGVNPQVSFGSFETQEGWDAVYVDECSDAECTSLGARLAVLHGTQEPGQLYESNTSHLRVRFTSSVRGAMGGFTATVSGGPSECLPCEAGTYAGVGEDCVACEAGTHTDVSGSAECSACPAGTFKPFEGPGACLPCPRDVESAEGGGSCECGAGHFLFAPSLSCSGSCPCTPWVGLNESSISSNSEGSRQYENGAYCTWKISGMNPQVTFGSFATQAGFDKAYLDECFDAECTSLGARLAVLDGQKATGLSFESSTSHLRIYFTSGTNTLDAGFTATVSGGPWGCLPCEADTYKTANDGSECTACPTNAVSGEGSTALSSCECPAGYTGDAGVGEDCVACEAGTFKDVSGSASCWACPTVSAQGSTAVSSCACPAGYTGLYTNVSGSAECSACPAGTFKPSDGPGTCLSCPGDAECPGDVACVVGASSCACGAGNFLSFGPPKCSPCEAGTYQPASNASGCSACPTNAVSAEGSTAFSSCECAAGYTGDAGVGEDCVACEADTFKDVSGSATCAACPANAVSLRGSTGLISCFCPGGYTGDAGVGASCVACEAVTFKNFDGPSACLPCPGDALVSVEGASSCACGAGNGFEHNVPSVTCAEYNSPGCTCTPSMGVGEGAMSLRVGVATGGWKACAWIVSGAEPRVSITSVIGCDVRLSVYECEDAACTSSKSVFFDFITENSPGWEYQSAAAHLRVSSICYEPGGGNASFTGTWNTTSKPPECTPCEAGTYQAATNASECTACPTNAVSAEGSSSCECAAGYTGDAGVGGDCEACEAGTFKDVSGSATCKVCLMCPPCLAGTFMSTTDALGCIACPTNAVSGEGSTALSSCECPAGYTGDAGVGEDCVPCEAGTHKDVSGSATCTVLMGSKKRSWTDSSTGFFLGGPPKRSSFGFAEAGGRVYMFGGEDATAELGEPPLLTSRVSTCLREN